MHPTGRQLVVDVDGPVHVLDFGGRPDAPVMLCVHGLGGSAAGWGAFAAKVRTHRVLAVDLPGHGRSPAEGRSVAVRDAALTVEALIAELGLGKVVLVGHSMGSAVAVLVAAAAPDAVERLVLLAPPLPRDGLRVVSRELIPHVALCACPRLGLFFLRRRVGRQTMEEYVSGRLRLTCESVHDRDGLVEAMTAELQAAYDGEDDPLDCFIRAARSVGVMVGQGRRYRALLSSLRTPVRVIHGAEDRVLKPGTLAQLRELQPDWETHLLSGVGHMPHLEAPRLVGRLAAGAPPEPRHTSGPRIPTRGQAARPRRVRRSVQPVRTTARVLAAVVLSHGCSRWSEPRV